MLAIDQFQSRNIFFLFLSCSLINIIGEGLHSNLLVLFSKPLLLFLLFVFFFMNTRDSKFSMVSNWLIFAILASNLGDILLLVAGRSPNEVHFFLGGLSAFLMTHIAYTIAFRKLAPSEPFKFPFIIIVPMVLYWAGFNYTFSSSLSGIMKPAVGLYSLIILVMVYFSWHLDQALKTTPTKWILWGALLFLISDTFVGLNKFGQDLVTVPAIGVLIMSTYLAAQAFIVLGTIRIIRKPM